MPNGYKKLFTGKLPKAQNIPKRLILSDRCTFIRLKQINNDYYMK